MSIKSFRGLLADGAVQKIRLGTINGMVGYTIRKFQIMPEAFGDAAAEHIVQVFLEDPGTAQAAVNFDNPLLLAAGAINNNASGHNYPLEFVVIFDNVKFNQDIYVTQFDNLASTACNFYLELETHKLTLDEATVATLKDMRGRE